MIGIASTCSVKSPSARVATFSASDRSPASGAAASSRATRRGEAADERRQDEVVLVGEVVVEHPFGDLGCPRELPRRDRGDRALGQEPLGDVEQVGAEGGARVPLDAADGPSDPRGHYERPLMSTRSV